MIRVLLVDDHELIRTSTKLLLNDAENITVIGEAKNGPDTISLARKLDFDVILMALNIPNMCGFDAILHLLRNKSPPKILVLGAYHDGFVPSRLLEWGVTGYLSKNARREEMLEAIHAVYIGNRYIEPSMANTTASHHTPQNNPVPLTQLSDRELQAFIMIVSGMERGEIAKNLYLSQKTTNGYIATAFKKLGVKTDAEAIRIAIQSGLVNIGD